MKTFFWTLVALSALLLIAIVVNTISCRVSNRIREEILTNSCHPADLKERWTKWNTAVRWSDNLTNIFGIVGGMGWFWFLYCILLP